MTTTQPGSDSDRTSTTQSTQDQSLTTSPSSTATTPTTSKTSLTSSSTTQQTSSTQHVTTAPGIVVQTSAPSSSQPSTLATQTSPAHILSASSLASSQTSSSSINWGPAITASPIPAAGTAAPAHSTDQPSSSFSANSRNAVIVSTTIGGTIILAFLLYALWRRRKGATYADIVQFRPRSGTIILSPARDRRLTALPIYRESRYSVRSSRQHASAASFSKAYKRPSGVPSTVAEHFHKQNPWIQNMWKTVNPPTPDREKHPLSEVTPAPPLPQLQPPEMARLASSHSTKSRMTKQSSGDTTKSGLEISIREASPVAGEADSQSVSPLAEHEVQDRWSWTNSQAPPTPRFGYAPSLVSSRASSAPRFRNITSWVLAQADRGSNTIEEEQVRPTSKRTLSVLKNKASKPNLAPQPTRKLSKNHHRSKSSFSSVFKRQPDVDVPPLTLPEPIKLDDSRPKAAPNAGNRYRP